MFRLPASSCSGITNIRVSMAAIFPKGFIGKSGPITFGCCSGQLSQHRRSFCSVGSTLTHRHSSRVYSYFYYSGLDIVSTPVSNLYAPSYTIHSPTYILHTPGRRDFHYSLNLFTHYKLLGIGPEASAGEIKKAFYELSKEFHPDSPKSAPHHEEKFRKMSQAYNVLKDPVQRRDYDNSLKNPGSKTYSTAGASNQTYQQRQKTQEEQEKAWGFTPQAKDKNGQPIYRNPKFSNGTVAMFLFGFIIAGILVNSWRWNSYSSKTMAFLDEKHHENSQAYAKAKTTARQTDTKTQLARLAADQNSP